MYFYCPEDMSSPSLKRGWHWVEKQEQFEVFFTLLEEKGISEASLLRDALAPSTYATLKMEVCTCTWFHLPAQKKIRYAHTSFKFAVAESLGSFQPFTPAPFTGGS
jgi:hypothetical protein